MASTNDLTNWGRWGAEDEQGSLNLITPELIKQAAGLVKTGKVYSLDMPLEATGPQWPQRHKTWKVTTFRNDPAASGSADDVVTMHSHSGTHMDALCHVWYHNEFYNGFKASENISSNGAIRNSIDKVPFIVGRGVLLDIAGWKGVDHLGLGEAVTATDLDQCAESQGVKLQAGDILLVRTGWLRVFEKDQALFDSGEPGLNLSTLPWLKQHDIVAIGTDSHAVEVLDIIPPPEGTPFHWVAIRDLGLYLLENLNLEELAADRAYEFLFVVAPLKLTAGVGSPINPVAIT
jgi:kynurenine formamidase